MIEIKGKGRTLITGFHGIGLVGFIAVDYMVRKLKAERVGWAFTRDMPSVVFASPGDLEMPVDFYRKGNIMFMKVNAIMERDVINEFLESVMAKLKKKGIKEIVVIGGLAVREKGVFGVANERGKELMKKLKLKEIRTDVTVFGPMASMLMYAQGEKIPAVCVLPNARTNLPDPEAASRAIKKIADAYGFRISVKDLEKEAKRIEARVKELEKKDELAERMFV